MKLYTKRGDDGGTDLFGGQRVPKESLRVEAYGTVDELNSVIGVAVAACTHDATTQLLLGIQSRLFDLGADLATPRKGEDDDNVAGVDRIDEAQIAELERHIDATSDALPPMRHFILPGGTELAARLHVARTVCRRAERICTALARGEPVGDASRIYLNRLSDLLFTLARQANQRAGVEDVPWRKKD